MRKWFWLLLLALLLITSCGRLLSAPVEVEPPPESPPPQAPNIIEPGGLSPSVALGNSERKVTYATGRFWVFFSDSKTVFYTSSTDGIYWLPKKSIAATSERGDFAVTAGNDDRIHLVRCIGKMWYSQGLADSTGNITWGTGYQIAEIKSPGGDIIGGDSIGAPTICLDGDNCPVIGYVYYDSRRTSQVEPAEHYRTVRVTRSTRSDGTWQTASGFPLELSPDEYKWVNIASLSDGILAVYGHRNVSLKYRVLNGSSWNDEKALPHVMSDDRRSMVGYGNKAYLGFLRQDGKPIFTRFDALTGGWDEGFDLTTHVQYQASTMSITYDTVSDCCFVFYKVNRSIRYIKLDVRNAAADYRSIYTAEVQEYPVMATEYLHDGKIMVLSMKGVVYPWADYSLHSELIHVQQSSPRASFVTSGTGECVPVNVAFADSSTGDIASWEWDFGDSEDPDNTATGENTIHIYKKPGTYTVTLKVQNAYGEDTVTHNITLSVPTDGK